MTVLSPHRQLVGLSDQTELAVTKRRARSARSHRIDTVVTQQQARQGDCVWCKTNMSLRALRCVKVRFRPVWLQLHFAVMCPWRWLINTDYTLINTDYSLLSTIQPYTEQHWLFPVINDTTIRWTTLTILCYQRYNHTLINTEYSMLSTIRLYTDQHWVFSVINDTTIYWSTLSIACVRLSMIQPYTDQRWLHQVNDCQQTIRSHTPPWTMTSP